MTPPADSAARRLSDTPVAHQDGRRARRSVALTVTEIRSLPAAVNVETAARCLNIGRDKANRLIREGDFPITVLFLGGKGRCRLVDICEYLGIELEPTP